MRWRVMLRIGLGFLTSARCRKRCFVIVIAWAAMAGQVTGQDRQTPEGWAWEKIKQGKGVDFNERCKTGTLDAHARDESRWKDGCRRISGGFLANLLTDASLRDLVPFAGIKIVGARIEGEINLQNVKFERALIIEQSVIEGDVNLNAARAESTVGFVDSSVGGKFAAWHFRCELSVDLSLTEFKQQVLLDGAKINGYLAMDGAMFDGSLDADSMQVGGNLLMRSVEQNQARFKEVTLSSARVAGNVFMDGARFGGDVNAD